MGGGVSIKNKKEMNKMSIKDMVNNSNGAIHVRYYKGSCDVHTKDERR